MYNHKPGRDKPLYDKSTSDHCPFILYQWILIPAKLKIMAYHILVPENYGKSEDSLKDSSQDFWNPLQGDNYNKPDSRESLSWEVFNVNSL